MNQPAETRTDQRAPIRKRWTAQPPGATDEAVAGAMLRSAATVRPFGARELAEVGARLRSKERIRPRPLAWQLAIVACWVLFGSALSAAVLHVLRTPVRDKRERETSIVARARKPVRHASTGATRPAVPIPPPPSQAESLPEPTATPARPTPLRPSRAVAIREKPEPAAPEQWAVAPAEPSLGPVPAASPSALAKESRLLARAIAKLRQEDDAEQALAVLDQYRSEFGAIGALLPEANATRIEALLRLGRHSQALALLDAETPATTGVGREMLVARAELRANRGRRVSALHDFDLLLRADSPADAVTERALYGRAVCRGELGNWDEARKDSERYLAMFPHGRFADKARVALNR